MGGFVAHGPEGAPATASTSDDSKGHPDVEPMHDEKNLEAGHTVDDVKGYVSDENAMAQIIGVAILEFGVILHRHVFCIGCPHFYPSLTSPV